MPALPLREKKTPRERPPRRDRAGQRRHQAAMTIMTMTELMRVLRWMIAMRNRRILTMKTMRRLTDPDQEDNEELAEPIRTTIRSRRIPTQTTTRMSNPRIMLVRCRANGVTTHNKRRGAAPD
jgi:hypothetical protein